MAHAYQFLLTYLTIPLYIFGWRISIGIWCRATTATPASTKGRVIDLPTQARERPSLCPGNYSYQNLGSGKSTIRLLKLEPAIFDEPLIGTLEQVDLREAEGSYTALSYVWGSLQNPKVLLIEGASISITSSLDIALRYVRSTTSTITLWVDAICIDQNKDREKGQQIPFMPKIYAQSETVLSWIGEATPSSTSGMDILSYLASDEPFSDDSPWNRMTADDICFGLRDILGRIYFRRIWIVQEAALGRRNKMQAGDISLRWEGAEDAQRFLTRIKLLEVSPIWQSEILRETDLRPIRELLEQSVADRDRKLGIRRPMTFLDLVHAMRHRESTDPRDRIYGLMGLASPAEIAGFSLDYQDSWEGLYQRFYDHVYQIALQNHDQAWQGS